MIRRALVSDPILSDVIARIVARVQPVRIVLFGSRARGTARSDSDYDLMVEADYEDRHACLVELDKAVRDGEAGVPVDIVLRKPGALQRDQHDLGFVDWDIAREGIVVYPPDAPPLPPLSSQPRPWRVSEEPPSSVSGWLARAAEDLQNIELVTAAPSVPWSTVAFHSQQAAEKYLKALLVCGNVRPPRTHSLAELVTAARSASFELPDLRADCDRLKDYAVDVRYPELVPIPDEAEGRATREAGERIVAAARVHLKRLGVHWPGAAPGGVPPSGGGQM